jgi:hypothetical protein
VVDGVYEFSKNFVMKEWTEHQSLLPWNMLAYKDYNWMMEFTELARTLRS